MRGCLSVSILRSVAVVALVLLIPSALHAQASIAGTVKDSSGAVLPGVTVEATSPALIEKTRSPSLTAPASIALRVSVPDSTPSRSPSSVSAR